MNYHYYAATAYGWAVADTLEQAIKGAARYIGHSTLQNQKKAKGGVIAVVCRVELPEAAHYSISEYLPNKIQKEDGVHDTRKGEQVPLTEVKNIRITTMSGKYIPVED